jgi:hypothetical protein
MTEDRAQVEGLKFQLIVPLFCSRATVLVRFLSYFLPHITIDRHV